MNSPFHICVVKPAACSENKNGRNCNRNLPLFCEQLSEYDVNHYGWYVVG
jgi:hypothetical protein